MASTYSTDLKIELMVTGENAGTWGDKTNTNWNVVQQAIAGYEAISIAGGAQTTALVMTNATLSSARNAVVKLTGTITGNQIVTIPDGIEKTYIIENGTTGAFTVQFKTVSGTGPTFSTTDKGIKIVYSNGTNVVDVNANLSGPTLASDLNVNGKSIISTSNGDITISPNGSGKVFLDADTVRVGDSGAAATLTTNGAGNLTINTNSGTNSGTIVINQGTNGNIAITPNGTGNVVLDGLNWPQADGSNGQVLQTNGSGQLAFATAAGGATQLLQSIPLATSNSVTAGKLASIGSSGEIVALPTLNTFGTTRTNSTNTAYSVINTDGSRAIRYTATTATSTNYTFTFTGVAISNSANPTNGTINVTDSFTFGPAQGYNFLPGPQIYAAGTSKFFVINSCVSNYDAGCGQTGNIWRNQIFTISIDSSGNLTKGNVLTYNGTWGSSGAITLWQAGKLTDDIFVWNYANDRPGGQYKYIFTLSSTNTTTGTSDSDAEFWTTGTGSNTLLTSNNILGLGTGATWRTAAYTSSPVGIGTKTDTTQIADYLSGGTWAKMANISTNAAEYVLATYTNTDGNARYITYSVNQTTGALTQVETGAQTVINSNAASSMVFKDKDSFVGSNASFKFTNGVANVPTYNSPYTLGTMRYNSSDLFYSFSTSLSGFPTNIGYTVNAYATNSFNYVGVAKTTSSTSPVNIVTDGVATGFTSLTPGTVYYATSPADGTVTTSSSSGILIGKAISSTEILLQRSNTQ